MTFRTLSLIVNNIKLPTNASSQEAFSVADKRLYRAGIHSKGVEFFVYRRSVDARRKDDIKFVYSILVCGEFSGVCDKALAAAGASVDKSEMPSAVFGSEPLFGKPVVVGSGPCGLFCALLLAENGYAPILIERGADISERVAKVNAFTLSGILDSETNIQFGAGGAGTFSDGKLVTRIGDGMTRFVLEKFVEFGAPADILYIAKPHIGTDILRNVVQNMINRIISLGGEVRFHTKLTDISFDTGKVCSITTNNGKIPVGALVLALGHSARDTYAMLMEKGISFEAKNFSVGMRIEHNAEDIDKAMLGDMAGSPLLGHAEYALSHNTKERGVYTFCMCPGGEVVAAASENGGVVVNGMSYHSRDGKNSNSAVVCTVFKEDYGASPLRAIEFQRKIERAAFSAAGSDYSAPIITFGDFAEGTLKRLPDKVIPTYRGGKDVRLVSPYDYLPSIVCDSIKNAVFAFDKKISGFATPNAVLTGPETRTSAPIRITRSDVTRLALGFENLYPAGEGAGYAGGITSAAVDGIRTALALMKKYKACENA